MQRLRRLQRHLGIGPEYIRSDNMDLANSRRGSFTQIFAVSQRCLMQIVFAIVDNRNGKAFP